jgi:hypothetical protein
MLKVTVILCELSMLYLFCYSCAYFLAFLDCFPGVKHFQLEGGSCYGIQTRISIIAHRVASGGAMAQ